MNIGAIREFLASVDFNDPDSINMRMIQKIGDGVAVFNPDLSKNMRRDLHKFYGGIIGNKFFEKDQSVYNPNIATEGTLQIADLETAHIKEVINDIENEDNSVDDVEEVELEKLNYYCFKFIRDNKSLYIFRRFTKMKKIRNGICGILQDNSFKKIEIDKFFGLDRDIDIIIFENEALIINRFALQTIFKLNDYFTSRAALALNKLDSKNIFENFSEFQTDCINDKMAARRITKIINTEGRIEGFLDNIEQLPVVIEQFDLDIELNDNKQIKYNGTKESRSQILFCISDAYYQSLILQRLGEDPS